MEDAVARRCFEHQVAFGLRGPGNVASAARIVERQVEHLAARHLLESHLRPRPVERTLDPSQVEANSFARFHLNQILTTSRARESAAPNRYAGAMFLESPELYDAIYHFKNYKHECEILRAVIAVAAPGARTILDVACGTGEHDKFLKDHYSVDGVDLNENYLRAARVKNPAGRYTHADMTEFDLATTYDAVTCLFSAIGYVRTVARMNRAVACMARHVKPGGVLIIEPWITPENWKPGNSFIHPGEIGADKVVRMSLSGREGNLSFTLMHYLRSTPTGIEHYSERLELGLFTREEMTHAFDSANMNVRYDTEGLMGRGLYIAHKRP